MASTLVIDPGPLGAAISQLHQGISTKAIPVTERQSDFLAWLDQNQEAIAALNDLKVMVSDSAQKLNSFLVQHGFEPMVHRLDSDCLGIVTVLKVQVAWAIEATKIQVPCPDGMSYQGFELPLMHVRLVNLAGFEHPIAQLFTQSDAIAWLVMMDEPEHELEMVEAASSIIGSQAAFTTCSGYSSVQVPCVQTDARPDLSWLNGLKVSGQPISQVVQVVRTWLNEEGGGSESGSAITTTRSEPRGPLVFDQPFMYCFTLPGSTIPIGISYAHRGTWEPPRADETE